MATIHDSSGKGIGNDNPLAVNVMQGSGALGTDIQSHLQTTIQTHNAVSVTANNGFSSSSWIDTDGYDKIAIITKNDAATASNININWSPDNGTTLVGFEAIIPSATVQYRAGITDTKARYCRIDVVNGDTIAHTMSSWVYLKA